jgi:hypothetical protein|tara:strand:- start:1446 stop:4037 length:2592 start_codon:yes stop_codon:yes gene_type:complete
MFCAKDYEQGFHRHLLSFVMRFPLLFLSSALVQGADAAPLSYNRDIRPILAENCFACHGPDKASREAKLRLDLREVAIDKEAFVPGDAEDSELVYLINTDDEDDIMPPPESHKSLSPEQKKLLAQWIKEGAVYEPHWAYIKPERPPVPNMGQKHPVDNFMSEGLKAEGLKLSPPADSDTLSRRLSLDLTGLPPVATGAKAGAKDIDMLMASPHFGERMAVHWLDLARYADTNGYHNDVVRDVTPYRDYVIDAFNNNKPYDEFIIQQLAGDLKKDRTTEDRVASTFNRLNRISAEGGIQDLEYTAKYYAERVRTTSVAFLGSTMGCAECHDHKFDPFTAKDFYSMQAFFADIYEKGAFNGDGKYNEGADIKNHPDMFVSRWGPALKLPEPSQQEAVEKVEAQIKPLDAKFNKTTPELEKGFEKWLADVRKQRAESDNKKPSLSNAVTRAFDGSKGKEPDAKQKKVLLDHYRTTIPELKEIHAKLNKLRGEEKVLNGLIRTTLPSVSTNPRVIRLLPRGDWTNKSGEIVQAAVPEFLTVAVPAPKPEKPGERLTRMDLAKWIATEENPLTARAYVNRVWSLFFGEGLSRDLQDLGNQGQWPTHPALLDWLAVEFVESGWDVKHLIKTIVTSKAYQQSSNVSSDLMKLDPYNVFYARQNPRRLPAEFVRDNALAVSGLLNAKLGGGSARPYQPAGYYAQMNFPKRTYSHDKNDNQYRRGLYVHWQRSFLHPMLAAFDAPAREECTAARSSSNTPLQALNLLNDPTFVESARVLAEDLMEDEKPLTDRLDVAFRRILSRACSEEEGAILTNLYEKQLKRYRESPEDASKLLGIGLKSATDAKDPAALAAMTAVCRALLNLHETITRY